MMVKSDAHLIFYLDEAWFDLHDKVNSQNSRPWNPQNPRLIPFHYVILKLAYDAVWVQIEQFNQISSMTKINSERYMEKIICPISEWLTDEECQDAVFQNDCYRLL
jgi:hypothetical protein